MYTKTGDNQDDKELVAKVLLGDNHSFAVIIRNTERLVTQIVFRMVPNAEDRKDVAQDIYLKAFKKLGGFRFECRLSTWIAQISYTTCLDHLKKKKLALVLDKADEDGDSTTTILSAELSTENAGWLNRDRGVILQSATEKLPPLYRTLITLYHTEELSYEEIIAITSLPEGTVKNYLFRARKMLKNILLQQYKKEDL